MLKHSEPSQSCSIQASWFSVFLASVENEGIEAIIVPKKGLCIFTDRKIQAKKHHLLFLVSVWSAPFHRETGVPIPEFSSCI